ncbi:hypothetical protein FRC06_000779 [Ceratobasidium sp. 370]|nr:hypothetical protein FRC06_000779 [Ceratobasidium sp. 370]
MCVRSDIISTTTTATTANWRPLFAPSPSPTSTKLGSSQVPLQLPSPASSPLKPRPRPKPASATVGQGLSLSSCRNGLLPLASRNTASSVDRGFEESFSSVEENSDIEVLSNHDEEMDQGMFEEDADQDQSEEEDESEAESELSGRGRMRATRYLDVSAKESRGVKTSNAQFSRPGETGGGRWTGAMQGLLSFRKRPNSREMLEPGKWSFSNDGVARLPATNREVGDIHFSPAYSVIPGASKPLARAHQLSTDDLSTVAMRLRSRIPF